MGQITVKLTGVKEIQRTLRLTEREMKKILRAAASKTGQRMRHVQKKQLRSRGVSPRATRSRSHGSRDSAWIGANPVPPDAVPGLVAVNKDTDNPQVILNGRDLHAFWIRPKGKEPFLVYRDGGRLVSVSSGVKVDFLDYAGDAHDAAAKEGEEYFLEEVYRQAIKELGGVLPGKR